MRADEVNAQLARILSSAPFLHAGRLSRFLRFVVEQSQNGNAGSLKEYVIGTEVFDRGKDYDPRVDPIVRTQAAKVRSKLLEYYAGEGDGDPIVISIPKGGYVPEFRYSAATAIAPHRSGSPAAERTRVAVLPFLNLSADPENEYFSDGLTEELINRLTCVRGLQVVARTSVFRFKGQSEDIREIGMRLGVGTILEGSVRKSTDQVRVTAQLIDVQSGCHLFAKTYQRQYKGIFELQDELAQAVVEAVTHSSVETGGHTFKSRTANLEAYNKYLRGTFALSNRYVDMRESVNLFQEALSVDPEFAPAWAGLAHAWWLRAWYHQMRPADAMPLAKHAALKTLELDANSAQGHSCLGIVESGFEWRWASAEEHFRKAIELQPGMAAIYPFYAVVCLLPQLRLTEACEMVERGTSIDPYSLLFQAIAAFICANAGRFQEALAHAALIREIYPNAPQALGLNGLILEWQGDAEKAIPAYRKACELSGSLPHPHLESFLGHALAVSGQRSEAEQIVQQLLSAQASPALDIARVYLGLRQAEEALRWLEIAAKDRSIHLLAVPADRRFDWLRPHPSFQNILRQMGL